MRESQHLYEVLKRMIEYAKKGDLRMVTGLSDLFSKFTRNMYLKPTEQDLMYDHCRQSCVFAVDEANRDKRQTALDEAERIFAQIPRPRKN